MLNSAITSGVNLFIQQTPLRQLPNEEKWIKDEEDLRVELSRIADLIKDTKDMIGKQMWRNQVYNCSDDAKITHEEILLKGEDEKATALARKHWMPMFHTVLEPVYDVLKGMDHREAIASVDDLIAAVYAHVCNANVKMHLDDALVAKAMIRSSIKRREEDIKAAAALAAKEKRRKKKKEVEELLKEEPTEDDEE